jgi:hypothetical protein
MKWSLQKLPIRSLQRKVLSSGGFLGFTFHITLKKGGYIMGRYLVLWEADETKIPLDSTVRRESWLASIEMVKEEFKSGIIKDWGVFLGQTKGFSIEEGTEEEVQKSAIQYVPYYRLQIIPILKLEQHVEAIKSIK